MGNTHGTWLPGDPRGFRTRHHRQHVQGDYKLPPPPGYYDQLLQHARDLLGRDAVLLDPAARQAACRILADALQHHQVQIIELSVSQMHWHLLARFVPVGVNPYDHLAALNIKLTHPPKAHPLPRVGPSPQDPRPGGRGLSAYDHDPAPRRILGLARSFTTRQLEAARLVPPQGPVNAQRPLPRPIESRDHQLAVAQYIRDHAHQGAAVLTQLD
jgi:hypothetical protein